MAENGDSSIEAVDLALERGGNATNKADLVVSPPSTGRAARCTKCNGLIDKTGACRLKWQTGKNIGRFMHLTCLDNPLSSQYTVEGRTEEETLQAIAEIWQAEKQGTVNVEDIAMGEIGDADKIDEEEEIEAAIREEKREELVIEDTLKSGVVSSILQASGWSRSVAHACHRSH